MFIEIKRCDGYKYDKKRCLEYSYKLRSHKQTITPEEKQQSKGSQGTSHKHSTNTLSIKKNPYFPLEQDTPQLTCKLN